VVAGRWSGADRGHRGGPGRLDRVRLLGEGEREPTYKGGIGFCPNLATCDNTDDVLVIDPRAGNATSNCAADNIALLDQAVAWLPGQFRHRLLVRPGGEPRERVHSLTETGDSALCGAHGPRPRVGVR